MRVALEDVAESVSYGVTASARDEPVGPKFLRITDIQNGSVDWASVPWCESDTKKLESGRLQRGDIVFARTGATTGKSFLIRDCPDEVVFASYLIRVRLGEKADPEFVSQFFQTADYWSQITKNARGVAQPGVNATTLKSLQIPLPPLAEQKRIAGILDAADALRAKRREALAQLDTLLQSTFLDMFGDPVTNPMGWGLVPLKQVLAEKSVNGAYYPKEAYSDDGIRMVHMADAFYGTVEIKGIKRVDVPDLDIRKYGLRPSDILVSRRSLNYEGSAKPCLIPESDEPLIFESSLIRVRPNQEKVLTIYLFHYLQNERARSKYVFPLVTRSTISGINQTNLMKVRVLVPPLDLQRRFAAIVESVEQQKARMRAHLAELDALFASLQSRAFNGEL